MEEAVPWNDTGKTQIKTMEEAKHTMIACLLPYLRGEHTSKRLDSARCQRCMSLQCDELACRMFSKKEKDMGSRCKCLCHDLEGCMVLSRIYPIYLARPRLLELRKYHLVKHNNPQSKPSSTSSSSSNNHHRQFQTSSAISTSQQRRSESTHFIYTTTDVLQGQPTCSRYLSP